MNSVESLLIKHNLRKTVNDILDCLSGIYVDMLRSGFKFEGLVKSELVEINHTTYVVIIRAQEMTFACILEDTKPIQYRFVEHNTGWSEFLINIFHNTPVLCNIKPSDKLKIVNAIELRTKNILEIIEHVKVLETQKTVNDLLSNS